MNFYLSNLPVGLTLFALIFFPPWSKAASPGARYLRYSALIFCILVISGLIFENSFVAKNSIDLMLNDASILQTGRYYLGIVSLAAAIISIAPVMGTAKFNTGHRKSIAINTKMEKSFLAISLLLLVLDIHFKGFGLLISRSDYLPRSWSGNFFANLLQYASFISIIFLYLSNFFDRRLLRILKWLLVISWQMYMLGMTSRAAISVGILYLLSKYLKGEAVSLKGKIFITLQMLFVYLLVLQARSGDYFGLRHIPSIFKRTNFFSSTSLQMVHENVVSSISIIGLTHQTAEPNFSNLLIASNPLPGKWTRWYEIAPSMRISTFIPYSGFGELSVFGILNFVIFVSFLLILIRIGIDFSASDKRFFGAIPIFIQIISSAFLFLMLQYNLRSCLRIFEMGIVIFLISFGTRKFHVSEYSNSTA